MATLMERLQHVLTEHFPGSIAELEQANPSEKIGGYLIWDGFEDLEQLDRQRRLGQVVRSGLPREDQLRVTTIFTFTPTEVALMREN